MEFFKKIPDEIFWKKMILSPFKKKQKFGVAPHQNWCGGFNIDLRLVKNVQTPILNPAHPIFGEIHPKAKKSKMPCHEY
jgi:hypothetical protein